jgi:hypothetical protein
MTVGNSYSMLISISHSYSQNRFISGRKGQKNTLSAVRIYYTLATVAEHHRFILPPCDRNYVPIQSHIVSGAFFAYK